MSDCIFLGGFEGNLDVLNFGDSFYGRHQGNLDKLVVIKELDETNKDLVKDIRQRNLLKYLLAKWNKLKHDPLTSSRTSAYCATLLRRASPKPRFVTLFDTALALANSSFVLSISIIASADFK